MSNVEFSLSGILSLRKVTHVLRRTYVRKLPELRTSTVTFERDPLELASEITAQEIYCTVCSDVKYICYYIACIDSF